MSAAGCSFALVQRVATIFLCRGNCAGTLLRNNFQFSILGSKILTMFQFWDGPSAVCFLSMRTICEICRGAGLDTCHCTREYYKQRYSMPILHFEIFEMRPFIWTPFFQKL